MKAILIFCICLFTFAATACGHSHDVQQQLKEIEQAQAECLEMIETLEVIDQVIEAKLRPQFLNPSPLAFQYIQQLTSAGCITWTGNPTGSLTVAVVNCECFEDPNSAASFKLRFISSRPNITVVSTC